MKASEGTVAIDPSSAVSGGLIVGGLSALAAWRITAARMEGMQEVRDKTVSERLVELKASMDAMNGRVAALSEMEARFTAAQETLNRQREASLQTINERLDRHDEAIRDHGETLRLTTELLSRVERSLGRVCRAGEE